MLHLLLNPSHILYSLSALSLIHIFLNHYFTLFGSIYGYGNYLANWLWLTVFYLMFCSLSYLCVLIINKVGKMISLYLGICLSGILLIIIALFRYVFSAETVHNIAELFIKTMGFTGNGTINYIFPILALFTVGVVFGSGSYAVIRKTELR